MIVSEFGPKGPRCRDNLTHWLMSTQVARENRRMAERRPRKMLPCLLKN